MPDIWWMFAECGMDWAGFLHRYLCTDISAKNRKKVEMGKAPTKRKSWGLLFSAEGPRSRVDELDLCCRRAFWWLLSSCLGTAGESARDWKRQNALKTKMVSVSSVLIKFEWDLYIITTKPYRADRSHKKIFVIPWDWCVMRGWMEIQTSVVSVDGKCVLWGWGGRRRGKLCK